MYLDNRGALHSMQEGEVCPFLEKFPWYFRAFLLKKSYSTILDDSVGS